MRCVGSGMNASAVSCASIVIVLLVASAAGCGKKGPAVEFVEGIVLIDGQPLAEANVGFSPQSPQGLAGVGKTDARGIFRLTATRGGRATAGVPIGEYTVTVSKIEFDLKGQPPPADGDYSNIPVKSLVPEAYSLNGFSPLEATVTPGGGGTDVYHFELDSKFKAPVAK